MQLLESLPCHVFSNGKPLAIFQYSAVLGTRNAVVYKSVPALTEFIA